MARGSASSLIRLVVRRLVARERPVGRTLRRALIASTVVVLAAATLQLSGLSHVLVVAMLGIGSLAGLTALCLYLFSPAFAVSTIGVALACASLMTALSVTTGFELAITNEMARVNGHVLMTKYGLDFFEYEELCDRWVKDPRVVAASPFAFSMVAVVPGQPEEEADDADGNDDSATPGPAILIGKGLDPARAADLRGLASLMGRGDLAGLRPGDSRHPPGLILGHRVAASLGVAPGDFVRVVVPAELRGGDDVVGEPPRHARFELLDVLRSGASELDRNLVLMHITAAQALFFREGRVTGIEFELADAGLADEVARDMEQAHPPVYRMSTWRESNDALLAGLRQIRFSIALILGLMILVAATSLISSLLLLVRRKRGMIAVLLALGGDGNLMFWVFESVGLAIGAIGAALGVALGGLYCLVVHVYRYPLEGDVYPVDHLPVVVRTADALGPVLAAIVLCGLASGPVAYLAARVRILAGLQR